MCGQPSDQPQRLCIGCTGDLELHRATVAADPDKPLSDEAALARLIVQRQRSWTSANPSPSSYSLDLAVVVVEIEAAGEASAFMLWPSAHFRRYGQRLIDLAENSDDFDAFYFNVHDGLDLFIDRRGPAGRHGHRGRALAPAAAATWVGDAGRGACAVRIEHIPGACPSEAIGQTAWSRLQTAIHACGIDLTSTDRAIKFEHGTAPNYEHEGVQAHPADLAIVVALLVDAGLIDPAICEDALLSAQLGADGTLLGHPVGRSSLAQWAVEHAWTRLHLADLDTAVLSATGLELWGYEHLGDLIDTWRPGRGVTVTSAPHDSAAEE
ncbi:hypothetical protein [Glycomyces tenuis]|nr:hypothetical protein [Glycomyces tenuis]